MRQGPEQADEAQIHQDIAADRNDLKVGKPETVEQCPCRHQQNRACQAAYCLQADRVIFLGDLPCQKHQRGKQEGDKHRQQRRRTYGGEARLDNHQRAGKSYGAGCNPADADLLAKEHPTHH